MREITIRDALKEALREEMRRDPLVFLAGTDVATRGGSYNVCTDLLEEFGPERVKDTPISEAAIVGCGLGAAITGMRPVIEPCQVDWVTIAMDQIVNQVAKLRYMMGGQVKVPLVIRMAGGSGGRGGGAQHSQSLEAWFVHVPGLYVVTPSTPYDAKGLLKASIRDDNPVLFFEHRGSYNVKGPVPDEEYVIPLGVADVKRAGRDVTVVATSMMVRRSLAAAEELAREGIEVEVVDPRTLVPFDWETVVASVKKTGRLVVVHEGATRAGIGCDIAARVTQLAFDYLDAPPMVVGCLDVHIPYNRSLEDMVIPNRERIARACREICDRGDEQAPSVVLSSPPPVGAPTGALQVQMPKLTTTMEEGTISQWLKREGDLVSKGEILLEVETDKAAAKVESPFSGRLLRVLAQPGVTVPILAPIAIIASEKGE